jgi:hypothetical protein
MFNPRKQQHQNVEKNFTIGPIEGGYFLRFGAM